MPYPITRSQGALDKILVHGQVHHGWKHHDNHLGAMNFLFNVAHDIDLILDNFNKIPTFVDNL